MNGPIFPVVDPFEELPEHLERDYPSHYLYLDRFVGKDEYGRDVESTVCYVGHWFRFTPWDRSRWNALMLRGERPDPSMLQGARFARMMHKCPEHYFESKRNMPCVATSGAEGKNCSTIAYAGASGKLLGRQADMMIIDDPYGDDDGPKAA